MHRDMKVGLSLGVLLVGVVGALFFRREPEKKPGPQLQNASQLDQQIAEKPRGPYLSQPEEYVDSAPKSVARTAHKPVTPSPARPAATLSLEDDAHPQGGQANRTVASNPGSKTPPPLSSEGSEWETLGSNGPVASATPAGSRDVPVARTSASDSAQAMRTHVVQSGETLSGLASKYLGSSARYREIYDANRDVLKSPDSMTAGMTLKIPAKAGRRGAGEAAPAIAGQSPASGAAAEAMTRAVSQQRDRLPTPEVDDTPARSAPAADRPMPRVTPVRRSPFAVGRNVPAAAESAPEATSVSTPEPSVDE